MDAGWATVDGRRVPLDGPAYASALDALRAAGFVGVKEGCGEGECGACAVLVARPGTDRPTEWVAVNACLVPAGTLDGQEVVTATGLGTAEQPHPVQRELADRGGSQCGFCTPGFVCALAAEFYRPDREVGDPDLDALSGNLCRCTGYRPIRDAARALDLPEPEDPLARRRDRPTPEPPPSSAGSAGGTAGTPGSAPASGVVRPRDLADAIAVLTAHPTAVPVAGATDLGVHTSSGRAEPRLLVAVDRLPELRRVEATDDALEIGAALTLTEVARAVSGQVPLLDALLPLFGSRLVRNGATLGGNLATASPVGDAAPVLIALGAQVLLSGPDGQRGVAAEDLVTAYRTTALRPGELIRAVRVPLPPARVASFTKISRRRIDDIAAVSVALALDVDDGHVRRVRVGLGGVAATPVRGLATEEALLGRRWDAGTVTSAAEVLAAEGTPIDDVRASAHYRRAMLRAALLRLHAEHPTPEEVTP